MRLRTTSGAIFSFKAEPKGLRPSFGRLSYTPETGRFHEELVRRLTEEGKNPLKSHELSRFVAPSLAEWATDKRGLDVIELGPAFTTEIPFSLEPVIGSYTAIDFSPPFLNKQRELLAANPELLVRCNHLVANTYELWLPGSSTDFAVAVCHPPLVSATAQDKILILERLHSLLRAGGTLAVFPWYFNEQPISVSRYILERFRLRRVAYLPGQKVRLLLILEKQ
ncbi:MAG: hypothetical protein GC193_10700 [Cryomorphaceae bacterium]|nr:hypothetical protein [Cryomorphaceae bacterium]